ncbi:hypothetical protein [Pseudomonas sp. MWU13-2100]|uniref:hypothetical protein n=1 Tax=Pseudomonas sp. MWU13-2100 TaxID=2935075 RepID=UPI00200F434C|nr:hypothetical protein [Pseudomonas sp. MWU13-2100]
MEPQNKTTLYRLHLSLFLVFSANATDVPITSGMPFLSARKALIKHGWKPSLANEMQPAGTAETLKNMGIIEIGRCTQGVQHCKLNYKK